MATNDSNPVEKRGNSLSLYTTSGKFINCVNYTHFIEISPEPTLGFIFQVTYYKDGILLVAIQRDEIIPVPTYLNNFDFIFIDLDFELIAGAPPLVIDAASDPTFYPGATIYPHGIVLLDDYHALMLVNEYVEVDIKEYNPDLEIPEFKIHTTSFAIVYRATSEILHARSTFYTLMDLDHWVDWLSDENKRVINDGVDFVEIVHIASINEVIGN